MPYGAGPLVREAILRARPWQRSLIGITMVATGALLLWLGHVAGSVLSIAGAVLLWRMLDGRRRHRGRTGRTSGEQDPMQEPM